MEPLFMQCNCECKQCDENDWCPLADAFIIEGEEEEEAEEFMPKYGG